VRRRTDKGAKGGVEETGFFTATYWSAIPCAKEEDEVGAEVV